MGLGSVLVPNTAQTPINLSWMRQVQILVFKKGELTTKSKMYIFSLTCSRWHFSCDAQSTKKEMTTIFFLPIYTHQLHHHTEGNMHLLMDMRTRACDSAVKK